MEVTQNGDVLAVNPTVRFPDGTEVMIPMSTDFDRRAIAQDIARNLELSVQEIPGVDTLTVVLYAGFNPAFLPDYMRREVGRYTVPLAQDGHVTGITLDPATLELAVHSSNGVQDATASLAPVQDGVLVQAGTEYDADSETLTLARSKNLAPVVVPGIGGSGSGPGPVPTLHTIYAAVSRDQRFVAADFTSSSDTGAVALPMFAVNQFAAFGVPADQPDPTIIEQEGSGINEIGVWRKQVYQVVLGADNINHNIWAHTNPEGVQEVLFPVLSGRRFVIR